MSDGNPGAISVLIEISLNDDYLRKYTGRSWYDLIKIFDMSEIYGANIYILYNDICDRDISKMIAVLLGVEMRYFNSEFFKEACSRQDRSGKDLIPVKWVYDRVKEIYPYFDTYLK